MPEPFRTSDLERSTLLARRLGELPQVTGHTLLNELTRRLYAELEQKGIAYKPGIYLSDEWGCPDRSPVIGIPFYLTDNRICQLVAEVSGCPVEDESEIMLYLRHEAGHAFNYAFELFKEPAWERVFGLFTNIYPRYYLTSPFSPRYVRHIPGWYAQKHPDEDFAESFAVWLKPESDWRERYAGTPALAKLLYVDEAARRLGKAPPAVTSNIKDQPIEELEETLADWCRERGRVSLAGLKLPPILSGDLRDLFPSPTGDDVADLLEEQIPSLSCNVHAWTGLDSDLLYALLRRLGQLIRRLNLKTAPAGRAQAAVSLAVFITTLAMNYQKTGRFVEE